MSDHLDGFSAYPYLAIALTEHCTQFACLPRGDESSLLDLARRQHHATGLAVQLVLGAGRVVLVDDFGECQRSAIVAYRYPLYGHVPVADPLPLDVDCADRDVGLAEYCLRDAAERRVGALDLAERYQLAAVIARARAHRWHPEGG